MMMMMMMMSLSPSPPAGPSHYPVRPVHKTQTRSCCQRPP